MCIFFTPCLCTFKTEQQCGSDSCFRVWFITHEDTVHHIPGNLFCIFLSKSDRIIEYQ